jgi:hypothetical protein
MTGGRVGERGAGRYLPKKVVGDPAQPRRIKKKFIGGSGLSGQIFLSTCIRRHKAAIATKSRKEEIGGSE